MSTEPAIFFLLYKTNTTTNTVIANPTIIGVGFQLRNCLYIPSSDEVWVLTTDPAIPCQVLNVVTDVLGGTPALPPCTPEGICYYAPLDLIYIACNSISAIWKIDPNTQTLLLQTASAISRVGKKVFYISGEESVDQVLLRAKRLGLTKDKVKLASSTNITDILKTLNAKDAPDVVIIDSIQTMFIDGMSSIPGTISQIRACTSELSMIAKRKSITMILVSHVTKDGQIAGPKLLEHMVDTVLYFEGDRNQQFRLLRSIKNRYGPAGEIGVFEMNEFGLEEVSNPSQLFLSNRNDNISGTAVFAGIEGSRPILSEIQALITPSFIPSPRRSVVGLDLNRLSMIIAVLGSRFGLNLSQKEVYLNVVGGLKISEPAVDLAICLALISAAKDIPLPKASVAIGEVSLTGEVRMVVRRARRRREDSGGRDLRARARGHRGRCGGVRSRDGSVRERKRRALERDLLLLVERLELVLDVVKVAVPLEVVPEQVLPASTRSDSRRNIDGV